ncbi:hypothetical protein AP064_05650 [Candidatus Liberibacter solanacearum]|uniref:Uncharacterized protein n=1 Tax=Candidatus Liberibacter solanacearum TaxID=556287 RepID=A0A0F4VJJ9_9HYPH|nr:hypothetical protein [Candidatus Liberibacter solanacearum]KJZ81569.1 hypothetical protein DJ66_1164 [Candidatus Liberibacter solanacearum]KQC48664.1 hypothetical protein AP064_05650 [Candidatus Liberibacter solanacearum]
MHYDEEKKLTQIKDAIEGAVFWIFISFIITIIVICSMKNLIIEKIENHEKTVINEIRKSQIGV